MNSFKAVSHSTFILYIEWLSPFLLLAKSNLNLQNLTFGLFAEKHTKMARTDCGCFGKNNSKLGVCSRKGRLKTRLAAENLSITDVSHAKDASSPRSYGLPRSEELRKEGGRETSSISLRTSSRADRTTSLARLITLTNHQPAPNSFCVSWHWNFEKPSCIHNYDCSFSRPPGLGHCRRGFDNEGFSRA